MTHLRYLPLVFALLLASCVYEFPIAVEPTRKIDARLVGTWLGEKPEDTVEVRQFDDAHYVLLSDGKFYRAYHTDVAGVPFVTIQSIDSLEAKERKYWFVSYEVADGGEKLNVRSVNKDTVPDTAKSSKEIEKLITENLKNPKLLNEDGMTYRRKAQ
jgi:hypothetical protein